MTREEYNQNPLTCDRCKKVISFEKRKSKIYTAKYCGNSCSVISTNVTRFTPEIKLKMGQKQKLIQPIIWNSTKRKIHSEKMKLVVDENPQSYSSENVCGRVKGIMTVDSYGNETKCLGSWELLVSEFLNKHNIKWTNQIDEKFEYVWNNSTHRYFPDFKLVEKDAFVEVKGYERERDRCKWNQFPKKLIIIKLEDIKKIKKGEFHLDI